MDGSELTIGGASDPGRQRERNEDFHSWIIPEDPDELDRHGALLVIADGMGGIGRGNVASELAVLTVVESYRGADTGRILDDLRLAVESANRAVHEEMVSRPELGAMGTTCTAAAIRGREAYFAHVGDTRAYLVRNGGIRQLTKDHSLVAALLEGQKLTPEEARHHPRRNVVTRGLGIEPHVEVDAFRLEEDLESGDTLVLCTDGLHGQVSDEELGAAASGPNLDRASQELIARANRRGGPDNITVLLARVGAGRTLSAGTPPDETVRLEPEPATAVPASRDDRTSRGIVWKLVLALLALVVLMAILWYLTTQLNESSRALDTGLGAEPNQEDART